jgi:hypothetical protein
MECILVEELAIAKCDNCGTLCGKDRNGKFRLEVGCINCRTKKGLVFGKGWKPIGVINNEHQ